jgi:hypothetical protein
MITVHVICKWQDNVLMCKSDLQCIKTEFFEKNSMYKNAKIPIFGAETSYFVNVHSPENLSLTGEVRKNRSK